MTDQAVTNEATSVAPEEATLKRSIQMKMFASKEDHREVGFKNAPKVLGQLVGQIFDVKEKTGTLPNGETKMSLLAIGEFEGMNYATGEVFQSTSAYLPGYYLETVQSMLEKGNANAILFAIEIVLTPTGKNIPTAYEVRNLVRRRPDNPINLLKAEMAAAGRLRLPKPNNVQAAIEGEVLTLTPELEGDPTEVDVPEPDDGNAPDEADAAPVGATGKGKSKAA